MLQKQGFSSAIFVMKVYSAGIIMHKHLSRSQKTIWKSEDIWRAGVEWMKMSCWWPKLGENDENGWDDTKARVVHYNQDMWKTNISWRTLKQKDYSSQEQETKRLRKARQCQIVKMSPDLSSLDFSCDIQMVGLEFEANDLKAWINPSFYQLLMVVLS